MAKKIVRKKKPQKGTLTSFMLFLRKDRTRFLLGVFFIFIGIFMLISTLSFFFTGATDQSKIANKTLFELIFQKQTIANWAGAAGAYISDKLVNQGFGLFSILIPIFVIMVGLKFIKVVKTSLARLFLLLSFILIWGSITTSLLFSSFGGGSHIVWGGTHGQHIERMLEKTIGFPGLLLVLLLCLLIFIVIVKRTVVDSFFSFFEAKQTEMDEDEKSTNDSANKISWATLLFAFFKNLKRKFGKEENPDQPINTATPRPNRKKDANSTKKAEPVVIQPSTQPIESIQVDDEFEIAIPKDEELVAIPSHTVSQQVDVENNPDVEEFGEYDPTLDLSQFAFPSSDLLRAYDSGGKGVDMAEQNANKDRIITTLQHYGIEITSIKATVGPTITLYEIVPKAGVRISKIRNLEDDIALSLSALGIRIIAPMPGKGTIGIEVPNKDPQIVSMQSVIASKKFQDTTFDLPVALGKTITNEIFMFDLAKMPHLLVAGATGQGKSVGLNAIITSLLYKKHPAEMKMVLVDPKMVEFNIYSRIEKHYLAKLPDAEKAIITDVSKVTQTLNSLTKEMDDRYELLMNAGVRNLKEYNEKFRKRRLNPLKGHRFLPYIVVIIDEFGDLIMTAGKEIEMPIARIAQKARAIGIHMVIATQRPTTNIITGTIKANFPARMAFRVTSQIDSRTILDMTGANQLIGRGDMLFSQGSDLVRIQCAFVDTPEVEGITDYIGSQQGYAGAFELPEYVGETSEEKIGSFDMNEKDSLFEEAARLIVVHQQGSTSLIQRKFSIGYNRAGRLMDQLEAAGIVGPVQGSKPRDVLVADEYSLENKLNSL